MGVHALYTAASGMDAQLKNIDVIANNVANINTDGFRRDRTNFSDLFYRHQALAGSTGVGPNPRPSGIHVGHGVRVVSTEKMFEPGALKATKKPTDIAIGSSSGNLFLRVQTGTGDIAYTRSGSFQPNVNGQLATPDGHLLADIGAVPQDYANIQIEADGRVFAHVGTEPNGQEVGQIQLARFVNPAGLTPVGENLFKESEGSGAPQLFVAEELDNVKIRSGFLESSNVSAIKELVQLIQGQRAYEINSNVVQTADEALQIANNMRG